MQEILCEWIHSNSYRPIDMTNENLSADEVYKRSIKSVKWTTLGEISSQAMTSLITLILARLLVPSAFGIIAIATIAIGFIQIWQNFGLREALIQRRDRLEEASNIIFWTNLTLGLMLYCTIVIIAPYIADFFSEPVASNVLRVLCLQVVIVSLFEVHSALIQRSLDFKPLFYTRIGGSIAPAIISIPMAFMGFGVWALVYGTLFGSLVQLIFFWRLSPWRPKLEYNFPLAKEMMGFSSWVFLEALLGWVIMWGDSIILGRFMGTENLGVYRVGFTTVTFVFTFLMNPINPIAYSAFSRLQSNIPELKRIFLKLAQLVAIVSLPTGVGLFLLSHPITSVIFGQKWQGLEYVISLIGLGSAFAYLVVLNPSLYRAIGRPDVNSKLLIVSVAYYIPVYLLVAPHGLLLFCLARMGLAILSLSLHIYIANIILGLPWGYLWSSIKTPLIASILMGFSVYALFNIINPYSWYGVVFSVLIAILVYFASIYILDKDLFKWGFSLANEVIKR
ncbi:MAG: hypothetical protein PWP63_1626 [Methanolobus sp.]|nr:hypothetical protein [Methanolobus sp.]